MFSVLDVSVLTVMYGRGCRALVKFEAQQESKRMGKASGLAGEAFYAGRCKKSLNAWISYVADFGNRILNRTWHGKYMKIRKASFSFWGCQNLKHKRQHRQRLKMGKAWIFRQALTIQKRQQTSANYENFGKTWKIKDVSGQSKQQIQQTLRGAVPYIVPQKGWRKLVGCENWNTLHDKEHAGKVHLFPHVKKYFIQLWLHNATHVWMPLYAGRLSLLRFNASPNPRRADAVKGLSSPQVTFGECGSAARTGQRIGI